ncbi:MAG: hypothetical protein JKY63_05945 [Rhodobiaceae bacterium]|nr:hypothetical protein [Rhodobiaceae bacterium]
MNVSAGTIINQAQTQLSISSVVLKKTFEADRDFATAIQEASENTPPPGTGLKVNLTV